VNVIIVFFILLVYHVSYFITRWVSRNNFNFTEKTIHRAEGKKLKLN